MTIEYQDSLLKYLFQNKDAKKYKDYLDSALFDIPMFQLVYDMWYKFVSKYNSIPTKTSFQEYADRVVKRNKGAITAEVYNEIKNTIAIVYTPSEMDVDFSRDVIIEYARRKGVQNLFINKVDKLKNATVDDIDLIYNEMRRIVTIGANTDDEEHNRGGFLFRDMNKPRMQSMNKSHPTFLGGINKTTAAKGFHAPQLILLLSGPKAFKTGTILAILREYARNGLRVYIADAENGREEVETRLRQGYMECEAGELSKYRAELKAIMTRIRAYGGDIVVDHYPANISTLDDVDSRLEELAEGGWVPNVIFYDYLQLFACANKKIFEKRLQISDVYHHARRLNNKYGMFAFTAAPIKQEAVNSFIINVRHFKEDFGQAYNCDAAFALCRTEDEQKEGNARIVPIVQRRGSGYKFGASTTCAIKINEPTETVVELDADAYMEVMEEAQRSKATNTPKRKYIPLDQLKDE